MNWNEPSLNSRELFLPQINNNPQEIEKIKKAKSNLVINISDEFKNVWFNGPKNTSSKELLKAVLILTKTLGEFIRLGQGKVNVSNKTSPDDFVTEVDMGIEMLFRLWLFKFFPEHKIIGEEGFKDEINANDYVWYIDPLDGTTNFVKGKQDIGINIGCLKAGKPYLAVVGNPFSKTYYFGEAEEKMLYQDTLSGIKQLKPRDFKNKPIVIGTEYKTGNVISDQHFNNILKKLGAEPYRIKSIALNLVALILGESTAFYREDVKLWDIVAPTILHSFLRDDYLYYLFLPESNMNEPQELFSNNEILIKMINSKNKTDEKMGIFAAVPKEKPQILQVIKDEFR